MLAPKAAGKRLTLAVHPCPAFRMRIDRRRLREMVLGGASLQRANLASADLSDADLHLANLAGGVVVGKLGTATVSREELSAALAADAN